MSAPIRHYLVTLGHGIHRNVIATSSFEAIRIALDALTISDQMLVTIDLIRITAKPARRQPHATA